MVSFPKRQLSFTYGRDRCQVCLSFCIEILGLCGGNPGFATRLIGPDSISVCF